PLRWSGAGTGLSHSPTSAPGSGARDRRPGMQIIDDATQVAERLGDPAVLARVLAYRTVLLRQCGDIHGSLETGRRAVDLLRKEALFDRLLILQGLATATLSAGAFDEVDTLLPEMEMLAARVGYPLIGWFAGMYRSSLALMRTGNLATFGALMMQASNTPSRWGFLSETLSATARLYLGRVEQALDELARLTTTPAGYLMATVQANLFGLTALTGHIDRARDLFAGVERSLPRLGGRHTLGSWYALEPSVLGLELIGDRQASAALYPATTSYIDTGVLCSLYPVGPASPQLAAAIAADAA